MSLQRHLIRRPIRLEATPDNRAACSDIREGVSYGSDNGAAQFSASTTGTLAYTPEDVASVELKTIQWLDRDGTFKILRSTPSAWGDLAFSPDGRRLALGIRDGARRDIWILDWERDVISKLIFGDSDDFHALWSPDGKAIAFVSNRRANGVRNVYWQRADGGGSVAALTTGDTPKQPESWHPNGHLLAITDSSLETGNDVFAVTARRRRNRRVQARGGDGVRPNAGDLDIRSLGSLLMESGWLIHPTSPAASRSTCVRSWSWRR